jgi:hypothetical protein
MLGAGVCASTVMTAFRYANGMRGIGNIRDQVDDDGEVERREELKKVRRRPLSETLQQLGEGRGVLNKSQQLLAEADFTRNLRPRLRGEEAATSVGQVRYRCQGSARSRLGASHISLEFRVRNSKYLVRTKNWATLAHVYTTSTNRRVHQDYSSSMASMHG